MNSRSNDSGQALMIVLLALAAVASVALTISTRSTTDVSVTTGVEDAQRAFTAAEAGIEKVLLDESVALSGPLQESVGGGGATYTATANTIPENDQAYAYPFEIEAGEVATLWFMSHDANNQLTCNGQPCYTGPNIRVCWGHPGTNATNAGALEVTVYHQNSSGQIIASRTTIDADNARRSQNRFSHNANGNCSAIEGQSYAFSRAIAFVGDLGINNFNTAGALKMMRVRILYNTSPQPIGFRTEGIGSLPFQGVRIDSLGSSGTSSRRLEAFSLYPVVPSMFEAALFSPPGVVKN
jgi:hypothetical protein